MLKRRAVSGSEQVKVTFAVPGDDPRLPASVVGDFNGWDPTAHRMRPRSNGTWSAVVTLDAGREYQFRYRSEDGGWFDEDEADGRVPNQFASTNCVIRI